MDPRQRAEYSAIVDRDPLVLPDGARLVVWPIVNVENWDIGGPMPRTVLPPPGGQTLVPDLPNWAWQEYGMRVGYWRLVEALASRDIRATLSINASVCEVYPRLTQAAVDADWEFMGHSYIQKPLHLVEDQRAAIRKSIDDIEAFSGKRPRGWLGPGLTETLDTPDLLAAEGIEYVADWVYDDQPTVLETASGPLYTIPYTVELNDIPMMMIQHHKSAELYDRAMDQFERLYAESAQSARIMAIAVHPYISGVPHRIKYFERIFDELAKNEDVVFWTGDQILDWYKSVQPS
ncbi:MAG: polysaccharide deacetylase family protein [Alphaproteobacteria bacterium]|nr:polysaccharide deacetylase family protein [Alphaproteobacteria bacterium]